MKQPHSLVVGLSWDIYPQLSTGEFAPHPFEHGSKIFKLDGDMEKCTDFLKKLKEILVDLDSGGKIVGMNALPAPTANESLLTSG